MLGFASVVPFTCLLWKNFHVCIVGSGPSAFYVAKSLLKRNNNLRIDMLEKLPAPFGLVRYGVAPDHQEVKNVINTFTNVAKDPRFNYYGNITVGDDIRLKELRSHYDAIVLSYGASADKRMNIPGEDLPGVLSARELVGWYNGYPNSKNTEPDLNCETVAIVGMGNVALDVARILLSSVDRLKNTDIPEPVMAHLSTSRVRRVIIIGRRGPLQASFTLKEFRELCGFSETCKTPCKGLSMKFAPSGVLNETLLSGSDRARLLQTLPRPRRRLIDFIVNAHTVNSTPMKLRAASESLYCEIRFLRSPIQVFPRCSTLYRMESPIAASNTSNVDGIQLQPNKLVGPPSENQRCVPASDEGPERVDCGLVVSSVGYRSIPIDPDLPFNEERGVIACSDKHGRVLDLGCSSVDNGALVYASGWCKNGASGAILNTLTDAHATADAILADLTGIRSVSRHEGFEGIKGTLENKGVRPVTFADWERVDMEEKAAGCDLGKPREKITSLKKILQIAFSEVARKRNGDIFPRS